MRDTFVPSVSVVLPVRDGHAYLRSSLKSILKQSLTNIECIVVDDGSVDDSVRICEDFRASDPRIRIHSNENSGLVNALNLGFEVARGEFVARMDADDVAYPDRLSSQLEFLRRNLGVVAVGGQLRIIDELGRYVRTGKYPVGPQECRRHLLFASPLCHPAVMMRAEAFRQAGGYRRAFEGAEDFDLWLRLSRIGDLANLPELVLDHRKHSSSITFKQGERSAFAATMATLVNGGWLPCREVTELQTIHELEQRLDQQPSLNAARCAYARAMATSESVDTKALYTDLANWLARSLPLTRDLQEGWAFVCTRAGAQAVRQRHYWDAVRLMALGIRYVHQSFLNELGRILRRAVGLSL